MIKTRRKNKINAIIYIQILFLIFGCDNEEKHSFSNNIKWKKIFKIENHVNFCQIDSVSKEYLFSYSHPLTIKGGFKIGILKNNNITTLFKSINNTIQYISINKNKIGFVEYNFDSNTLNSTLFISSDLGRIWRKIETPLNNIRKVEFLNDFILIEGDNKGSGHIYKSSNGGKTWIEINILKQGYKDLYLMHYETTYKNSILCKGSKSFNDKNSKLLQLDIETGKLKKILDLKNGSYYFKVISRNTFMHAIVNKNKLWIYSIRKNKLKLKNRLRIPNSVGEIINIYMSEKYYFLTAREKQLKGNILTWISTNRGKTWSKYKKNEEFQLVYNTFGKLYMKNKNNIIYKHKE